jgi:hypothetical protein
MTGTTNTPNTQLNNYTNLYLGHYASITDDVVNLGGSKLKSVASAVDATDAVNKSDLDTAVNAQKQRIDLILATNDLSFNDFKDIVEYVKGLDGTTTKTILEDFGSLSTEVLDLSNNIIPGQTSRLNTVDTSLNTVETSLNIVETSLNTVDTSLNDLITKNQTLENQVSQLYRYFFDASRNATLSR